MSAEHQEITEFKDKPAPGTNLAAQLAAQRAAHANSNKRARVNEEDAVSILATDASLALALQSQSHVDAVNNYATQAGEALTEQAKSLEGVSTQVGDALAAQVTTLSDVAKQMGTDMAAQAKSLEDLSTQAGKALTKQAKSLESVSTKVGTELATQVTTLSGVAKQMGADMAAQASTLGNVATQVTDLTNRQAVTLEGVATRVTEVAMRAGDALNNQAANYANTLLYVQSGLNAQNAANMESITRLTESNASVGAALLKQATTLSNVTERMGTDMAAQASMLSGVATSVNKQTSTLEGVAMRVGDAIQKQTEFMNTQASNAVNEVKAQAVTANQQSIQALSLVTEQANESIREFQYEAIDTLREVREAVSGVRSGPAPNIVVNQRPATVTAPTIINQTPNAVTVPDITVDPTPITVNAPKVIVNPTPVTFAAPTIINRTPNAFTVPDITVDPTPITVASPNVIVNVPAPVVNVYGNPVVPSPSDVLPVRKPFVPFKFKSIGVRDPPRVPDLPVFSDTVGAVRTTHPRLPDALSDEMSVPTFQSVADVSASHPRLPLSTQDPEMPMFERLSIVDPVYSHPQLPSARQPTEVPTFDGSVFDATASHPQLPSAGQPTQVPTFDGDARDVFGAHPKLPDSVSMLDIDNILREFRDEGGNGDFEVVSSADVDMSSHMRFISLAMGVNGFHLRNAFLKDEVPSKLLTSNMWTEFEPHLKLEIITAASILYNCAEWYKPWITMDVIATRVCEDGGTALGRILASISVTNKLRNPTKNNVITISWWTCNEVKTFTQSVMRLPTQSSRYKPILSEKQKYIEFLRVAAGMSGRTYDEMFPGEIIRNVVADWVVMRRTLSSEIDSAMVHLMRYVRQFRPKMREHDVIMHEKLRLPCARLMGRYIVAFESDNVSGGTTRLMTYMQSSAMKTAMLDVWTTFKRL